MAEGRDPELRKFLDQLKIKVASCVESARGGCTAPQLEDDFMTMFEISLHDTIIRYGFRDIIHFLNDEMAEEVLLVERRFAFEEVLGMKWPPSSELNRIKWQKIKKPEQFDKIVAEWENLNPDELVVVCKDDIRTKHIKNMVINQKPDVMKNLGGGLKEGGRRAKRQPLRNTNLQLAAGFDPATLKSQVPQSSNALPRKQNRIVRALSPAPIRPMTKIELTKTAHAIDSFGDEEDVDQPIPLDEFPAFYKEIMSEDFLDTQQQFGCSLQALFKAHSRYFDVHFDAAQEKYTVKLIKGVEIPKGDLKIEAHCRIQTVAPVPENAPLYNKNISANLRGYARNGGGSQIGRPANYPYTTNTQTMTKTVSNPMQRTEREILTFQDLRDRGLRPPAMSTKTFSCAPMFISEYIHKKGHNRVSLLEEMWWYLHFILTKYAPPGGHFLRTDPIKQLFYHNFNMTWDIYMHDILKKERINPEPFLECLQEHVESQRNPVFELQFRLRATPLTQGQFKNLAALDKKCSMGKQVSLHVPLAIIDNNDRVRMRKGRQPDDSDYDDDSDDGEEDALCERMMGNLPEEAEQKVTEYEPTVNGKRPYRYGANNEGPSTSADQFSAHRNAKYYALLVEHFPLGTDINGFTGGVKKKYAAVDAAPGRLKRYMMDHMVPLGLVTITMESHVHYWVSPRYDVKFLNRYNIPTEILERTNMTAHYRAEQNKLYGENAAEHADDPEQECQIDVDVYLEEPAKHLEIYAVSSNIADQVLDLVVNMILPMFPGGIEINNLRIIINRVWETKRQSLLPSLAKPLEHLELARLLFKWTPHLERQFFFGTGTWIRNSRYSNLPWNESCSKFKQVFSEEYLKLLPEPQKQTQPARRQRVEINLPAPQNISRPIAQSNPAAFTDIRPLFQPINPPIEQMDRLNLDVHRPEPQIHSQMDIQPQSLDISRNSNSSESSSSSVSVNVRALGRMATQNNVLNRHMDNNEERAAAIMIQQLDETVFNRFLTQMITNVANTNPIDEHAVYMKQIERMFAENLTRFINDNRASFADEDWREVRFEHAERRLYEFLIGNPLDFTFQHGGNNDIKITLNDQMLRT